MTNVCYQIKDLVCALSLLQKDLLTSAQIVSTTAYADEAVDDEDELQEKKEKKPRLPADQCDLGNVAKILIGNLMDVPLSLPLMQ